MAEPIKKPAEVVDPLPGPGSRGSQAVAHELRGATRMTPLKERPFYIRDGMIAVAMVALYLSLGTTYPYWLEFRGSLAASYPYMATAVTASRLLVTPWLCLTFAYVAFRFSKPRPSFNQIREQPGFVACAAALIIASTHLIRIIIQKARWGMLDRLGDDLFVLGDPASAGVIGGWLGLWFLGRWNPDAGWMDRMGRVVGWGWISIYATEQVGRFVV